MQFSLENRTVSLGVGEFADFSSGPRDSDGGPSGLWRAQLGQRWHTELRTQTLAAVPGAAFEIPLTGAWSHPEGWTFTFAGRIDQLVPAADGAAVLREIKTVTRPLPAPDTELRSDHPSYFIQLATYAALLRTAPAGTVPPSFQTARIRAELVFVETSSGLAQTVPLAAEDETLFQRQLDRVVEFLRLRLRARERLRALRFHPAFAAPRPGQENIQRDLTAAFAAGAGESAPAPSPILLFEAPTGFGKTGCLLEFALARLRAGRFERAIYLTGKSTGQLQVMRQLQAMTAPAASAEGPGPSGAVAAWQVRPKSEHCINHTFHCVRDTCAFLDGAEARWPRSGLARFYLFEDHPRDLETLRAAGRDARICPYEITRAALPFNDVWIADYNYVFSPANRAFMLESPGFDAARTLLLIDEAHNLPARVADAHSHEARADDAQALLTGLHHLRPPAPLLLAWEDWTRFLASLAPADQLDPALEADARDALDRLAGLVAVTALDHAALGPRFSGLLWSAQPLRDFLADDTLPRLLWVPERGVLRFTCLDAAAAIGETLRSFGGVVLASATLSPLDEFAAACGLDTPPPRPAVSAAPAPPAALGKLSRRSRQTLRGLTSGAALLQVEEAEAGAAPRFFAARTPWRDGAYRIAIDTRVDTTYRQRSHHYAATAAACESLHAAAGSGRAIAVFFPSYAYAEAIQRELAQAGSALRVALQPRLRDLAAQTAWVEASLAQGGALFLILGSSFAESIDLLGGRVSHALVAGPALPEVNALQKARLAEFSPLGRDAAFRRVYQIPGMMKVNQALGRLVRAPGQRAAVLLHCRRFADPAYAALLAPEYQSGTLVDDEAGFVSWLAG